MATIGSCLTLMDWARRVDPNGKVDKIVEMQKQTNEVFNHILWSPTNTTTQEKVTIRTGIPTPTWRQINKGVAVTKSQTATIPFDCGVLEDRSEIDEELINIVEGSAARSELRVSESFAHIEGIGQELARTLIYGDTMKTPERFTGLHAYYNEISDNQKLSGYNVVSAGGIGNNNTSMFLVVFSFDTIYGIFPKNTKAGVEHEPIPGKIDIQDADGKKYRGYGDVFKQRAGLVVRDWRYGGRICNINVDDLLTAGLSTGDKAPDLVRHGIILANKIPTLTKGRAVWLCNNTAKTGLDLIAEKKISNQVTMSTLENGFQMTRFMGVPVARVDAILNTEDRIS